MDYSRQIICDLVFNYQKLHDYELSTAGDAAVYRKVPCFIPNNDEPWKSFKGKPHHQRSPFESSVVMKVDLDKAIQALTWREKFVLLATVYEKDGGIEYFCDWLSVDEKQMKELKDEVLNKMVRLMNPGDEHRGGYRNGAGRPKKSKIKK
jgi:hypothetical protein